MMPGSNIPSYDSWQPQDAWTSVQARGAPRVRAAGPAFLDVSSPIDVAKPIDLDGVRRAINVLRAPAGSLGATEAEAVTAAGTFLAIAGVLAVGRAFAGYYVGGKMGRPVAGAITAALFGPFGLAATSFWAK